MNTFELLSPTIQKKIWEMRWESFTPVQDETIPVIIHTEKDIIISSDTASGKTEAAFLPILSKIEKEAIDQLKVVYISPLKALINNQFERINNLCKSTHIPIHRWHGDVSQSRKNKLVNNPAGILQITPESIESLFINRTEYLDVLFKNVDFIIIDEIHSFIDNERGVHLRSLLSRMEHYTKMRPRIIGLSATIDNFKKVKQWVNFEHPEDVEIIKSQGYDKKLLYHLMYFETAKSHQYPIELFYDIRELTRSQKAIIFCNSRSNVEELTYFLNRLSKRENMGQCYYPHHSSIDKRGREHVEKKMIESKTPISMVSTSTLELGIDIGDVDIIIQLNNTFTVSSLKQRLGRSGRKKDSDQILQLYATEEDNLLQSLAVMEMNLEGWVEPARGYDQPYDIVFHQIISLCAEKNGLQINEIIKRIFKIGVFKPLSQEMIQDLIAYMIKNDILQVVNGTEEVIVGLEGEHVLRSKDFYAVFMSPEAFTVIRGTKIIGTIDKTSMIKTGDNLILSGQLWTIKEIDDKKNKIHVTVATDGRPPRYFSGIIKYHPKIGEKMMDILVDQNTFEYIDENAKNTLIDMRKKYHYESLTSDQRPVWIMDDLILFETFTGSLISKTIYWMLKVVGIHVKSVDLLGRIKILPTEDFKERFQAFLSRDWRIDDILGVTLENELFGSKYTDYLPEDLIIEMHKVHEIDLDGAVSYIEEKEMKLIYLLSQI